MRLSRQITFAACLACFGLAGLQLHARNVTIAFSTTNSTPLNLGFAGFTTELLGTGVEYADTNMQQLAATLSPGWLLYPAGTTGDAFCWSNGLTVQSWIYQIASNGNASVSNLCQVTYNALRGKGGALLPNFVSMAENLGGARIIICVNAFTDSTNSIGALATFTTSNHIPIATWELCNEPYLFKGSNNFFTSGADYVNKMKPYRDAIKAADPNAVVAVFFSDPAIAGHVWDNSLIGYTNRYWDAVVYHHYPRLPATTNFFDLMAFDNGILFSNSASFVSEYLVPNNRTNVAMLVTEMNPNLGNGDGTQNLPTSSLYAGIWVSEYVMRLSTIPQVSFAGGYQLVNGSGIDLNNKEWNPVTNAAANGYVTNTVGLPFGYFLSAQGAGEAVAYWAINRSTAVYVTTVSTNGPTVPIDTNGVATIAAIYAQAYQGGNGKRYVVLTNKGSNAVPVQIIQDSFILSNQFQETFVTGIDPSVVNVYPAVASNVVIQINTVTNPVSIPSYSVVRLEWTVFAVPPPSLSLLISDDTDSLQWTGLTNVAYSIQGTTNLAIPWSTVGRVAGLRTNYAFTNWSSGAQEFFRLSVP